jgi:hypothetical protein
LGQSSGYLLLRFRQPGPALVETIAFTIHFQDVHVMRQSVQQCTGQAFGAEGLRPFFKRQVAGDEGGTTLVSLGD